MNWKPAEMETSLYSRDNESQLTKTHPSWALIRKPLRRHSADDYNTTEISTMSCANTPERPYVQPAESRTPNVWSFDDCDFDSDSNTQEEIRVNPLTTYRRAPKSIKPKVPIRPKLLVRPNLSDSDSNTREEIRVNPLITYRRAPKTIKPKIPIRPKLLIRPNLSESNTNDQPLATSQPPEDLNVSVISNFTPIGQVVTYRRVPVLPDIGPHETSQNQVSHINHAFQSEDSPFSAKTLIPDNTDEIDFERIQCKSADEQNSSKHLCDEKQLQNDITYEPTAQCENSKTNNMKVLPSTAKMKACINELVTNMKNAEKTSDETKQFEEEESEVRSNSKDPPDNSYENKQPEPFIYCKLITKYPKSSFLLTFAGHVLIAITTISLLLYGYDLFPTDFETLPMSDWKVPWKRRDFAWRYRDDYENRYVRKWFIEGQHKWYRSMEYGRANVVLYYDTGNGNIFEKENLQHMQRIEDRIFNIEEYRQYCVQTTAMNCQKPTSIIRLFDGTFSLLDSRFYDPGFNNIADVLYAAQTNNYTKSKFAFFLSRDAVISPTLAYATVTRTVIPLGYPLQIGEHGEKMENKMEAFLVKYFKPVIEKVVKENTSKFKLIYWSYLLFRNDIVRQILYDSMFAVGSAMFIFVFIVYHTKSLWISSLAVFSILTSFLATNLLYRVALDYKYFGFFHVIAFFIILGIGADDLFVFLDVWKSTGFANHYSLAHRLSDAYKKSVLSMFFTSLTTAIAFFANAFSPLLAPQSFGIFAGLLVIVNYISVIVYFPTVVIIHHLYFKSWEWPCVTVLKKACTSATNRGKVDMRDKSQIHNEIKASESIDQSLFEDNTSRSSTGNLYNVVGKLNDGFIGEKEHEYGFSHTQRNNSETPSTVTLQNNTELPRLTSSSSIASSVFGPSENARDSSANVVCGRPKLDKSTEETESNNAVKVTPSEGFKKKKKKKALVIFFRDYYFRFVTHWLIRWIIVVILMAVVAFFAYSITKLETENEQVKLYRNSHNYGRALDLDFHYFVANEADRNVRVHIVWGLKPRDMSVCHFSDGRCEGKELYDEEFNPNTPEAQLALKKFCDRLHSFTDEEIEYFSIRRHFVSNVPEIRCFVDELDGYLREQSQITGKNLTLPWTYRKMIEFMQSKSDIYNAEKLDKSYTDILQVPLSYWMNDGYRFQDKSVFNEFHSLIGESISHYSTPLKSDMSVFVGNKIRYIGVQVNLTLGTFTSGYPVGKPAMDRWEKFVNDQMKEMPKGLQNGFQLTRTFWHSISVQKTMADNAILGIVVGILFAFPILTVATQNVIIAFFAIVSMCCSTVCVIGVIPLAGWKLGILESLNMCMVVGLTVDYVVHLAEGYHMSTSTDRQSRVRDMLELMGISVFSGACTTLGASVFMVFAQIQFIIRFGIFMFCTIGFSLLYSLGLFTTLMGIVGPNGNTGDIKALYSGVISIFKRKKGSA